MNGQKAILSQTEQTGFLTGLLMSEGGNDLVHDLKHVENLHIFPCNECGQKSKNENELKQHVEKHHIFLCDDCGHKSRMRMS